MLRPLLLPAIVLTLLTVLGAAPVSPTLVADAATGTPSFNTYAAPTNMPSYNAAGEPSVGINWATNNVMYQSGTATYRVTFDDTQTPPTATWLNRKPVTSVTNVDPILATDHVSGRTYAGGLDGSCSVMSSSDNDGGTWTPMGNVCAGAAFDHPTIGSGPWANSLPHVYNRAVYYCAQVGVVQCAVSQDGGTTFGPGINVPCVYQNPGLHGSVHVGPDGWAYLPFRECGPVNGVAASGNSGVSWISRPITGANSPPEGFDPDVATTPSGWVWVGYPTSGYGVGVALSKDHGGTWTNFGDVAAAAGVKSSTFHEMVAGDNGRAAVAYLGSTTDGNPHASSFTGIWNVYVSYTFDEGVSWTTVKTSTNIAQKGWICAGGFNGCNSGRNLLDFIDAQIDSKGRVVVGYADGCVSTCETGSGASNQQWATIARQSGGKSLLAAYD